MRSVATTARGLIVLALFALNLGFWGIPVTICAVLRFLLPIRPARVVIVASMVRVTWGWIATNSAIARLLPTRYTVRGLDELDRAGRIRNDGHYLIVSNHQSWVDIFVLFQTFHRRTPLVRFFMKHQLLWFPVVGIGCWALDFPFMKRYSQEYLAKHPEKRGTDLETTRRACRRYRHIPVSLLAFIEGTRFTLQKHADQESPYMHLLRPRFGGIGYVVATIGEQLDDMLDATIVYRGRGSGLWEFVSGQIDEIIVDVREIEVHPEFFVSAIVEPGPKRDAFKSWVQRIWAEKDALIGRIRREAADDRWQMADGRTDGMSSAARHPGHQEGDSPLRSG